MASHTSARHLQQHQALLLQLSLAIVASSLVLWVLRRRRTYKGSSARERDDDTTAAAPQRKRKLSTPPPAVQIPPPEDEKQQQQSAIGGGGGPPVTPTTTTATKINGIGGGGEATTPQILESPSPYRLGGPRQSRTLSTGPSNEVLERVLQSLGQLPGPESIGRRRIELLVHNISHKDMILSLSNIPCTSGRTSDDLVLCRPKFSLFQWVSEKILETVSTSPPPPLARFPVYKRERDFSAAAAQQQQGEGGPLVIDPVTSSPIIPPIRTRSYTFKQNNQQAQLPVGFDLREVSIPIDDLASFRIRRDDAKKLDDQAGAIGIDGVYFPLLANIVPKWQKAISTTLIGGGEAMMIAKGGSGAGGPSSLASLNGGGQPSTPTAKGVAQQQQEDGGAFKIIFLVSGVGIPRDQTSSTTGNSTEGTARLIELFLQQHHPNLTIVRVHSTTNIFRYDENIAFVKNELLPLIEHYRDQTAERWGTEWRNKYRITISFADGSPARISAINASLRPYRPSFMHMWELKTFWHHAKMCLDDVEVHSFEDIDTAPAVPISQADNLARLIAYEMMQFKHEVLTSYRQGLCKDLSTFWLRKTKKPVLAVLLVQKEGQDPVLYRGCNMEVSMPTGSLCAERNAIGSALASDLTLKRRDLKIVAVLSLAFKPHGSAHHHHVPPANASTGLSLLAGGRSLAQQQVMVGSEGGGGLMDRTFPSVPSSPVIIPFNSLNPASHQLQATTIEEHPLDKLSQSRVEGGGGGIGSVAPVNIFKEEQQQADGGEPPQHEDEGEEGGVHFSASPPRVTVIRSFSLLDLNSRSGEAAAARAISVDSEDLNPLKPCGACMEWLKKIAEKCPEFRVATFTDESMSGIFLNNIVEV